MTHEFKNKLFDFIIAIIAISSIFLWFRYYQEAKSELTINKIEFTEKDKIIWMAK